MSTPTQDQASYVNSLWRDKWEGVIQAQNQVVNWLFAVHGGGIAGTLTYASVKSASCGILLALISFALGLIAIVVYGAFMYYLESRYFRQFRSDVSEFYKASIDWPEFIAREKSRPEKYRECEVLAWSSGVLGFLALVFLSFAIF